MPINTSEKVRENRLRRMAARQGFSLHKSPRRDPLARDFGRWYIVDAEREHAAAEIGGYDVVKAPSAAQLQTIAATRPEFVECECADLDAVERYLTARDRS